MGINVVVFGVAADPAQRAEAVFHRRRRQRHTGGAVFDVDHIPAQLQKRQEAEWVHFLGESPHPAASVKEHQRWLGPVIPVWCVDVELSLEIVRRDIGDIAADDRRIPLCDTYRPRNILGPTERLALGRRHP